MHTTFAAALPSLARRMDPKADCRSTITYNADYQPSGISFLSVYGWFTDPLTEYYICENYGSGSPAGGDGMVHKGQLESDGSTYDVYAHQQVNAPSIRGTTNFMQYWSIRNQTRTSGTINTANHYNYWKSIGLSIGTFGYQVLATEGVKSSGKSTVTVSEGGADAEPSASMSSSSAAAASTASSVESASSATPVASSASSTPYSATTSAISSAAAVTIPSVVPSSAPYGNSLSSVAAPSSSSAMDSSPTFGGQAPGAGVPFGSGSSHLTPGSMPTPRVRHHGHHRHGGYYEHLNRNVYPGGY